MAVKQNYDEILENRAKARKEATLSNTIKDREKRARTAAERAAECKASMHYTLKKLLSGEHITGYEGRQFFWDLIANSSEMHTDPMTGNSRTYYNLGAQHWPKKLIELAESVHFDLAMRMRKEARERKEAE